MRLSILIPVFNEEQTIKILLKRVLKQKYVSEVIIVDDGSTDQTVFKINQVKSEKVRLFQHPQNLGKGSAISTALKHAAGDVLLAQDADLECNPEDYPSLLQPLVEKRANFVSGNRWRNFKYWTLGRLGNVCLTQFFNLLYRANLTDMCSCCKVGQRSIWKKMKLKSTGFEIETEIMAKAKLLGLRIEEVPVSYTPRKYNGGKKIHAIEVLKMARILLKMRFSKS